MTDFKVGDQVKYVGTAYLSSSGAGRGVVSEVKPYGCKVLWNDSSTSTEGFSELELAESTTFDQNVHRILNGIADTVSSKNLSYGDSALNPVRIFSKADRMEQLFVRLDDKLSRVQRGHEYPGDDTIRDIIGYCTLILIARESN